MNPQARPDISFGRSGFSSACITFAFLEWPGFIALTRRWLRGAPPVFDLHKLGVSCHRI